SILTDWWSVSLVNAVGIYEDRRLPDADRPDAGTAGPPLSYQGPPDCDRRGPPAQLRRDDGDPRDTNDPVGLRDHLDHRILDNFGVPDRGERRGAPPGEARRHARQEEDG